MADTIAWVQKGRRVGSIASLNDAWVAFGAQLAERRRAKNLSQEELAERLGISRNQLQNLEQGMSDRAKRSPANPRLSTLVALCRELGGVLQIDASHPTGLIIRFE